MRRTIPIHQQLYIHLFPNPSPTDPPSFTAHLARNLVPEVRIEVATFYGDLNSVEARYPGLNYCYAPHRLRLGRFKHHRRLFKAFDALNLTEQEIQDLCCWEGSKWARQKYEEDQGVKVMDTTGDEIGPWVDPRHMTAAERSRLPPSRKMHNGQPIERPQRYEQDTTAPPKRSDIQLWREQQPQAQETTITIPLQHTSNRAQPPLLQDLQARIVQAWANGQDIPADLEAMVKAQVERGELPDNFVDHALADAEMQRMLLRQQHTRRQALMARQENQSVVPPLPSV